MFKCYHCGDDLRWNNDYDAEDDENSDPTLNVS